MPSEKGTVLYVGGFEMPDKNAAAHRVLNNGKALRELGYNVVFLGISHSATELVSEMYQGFECWSIPYPKGKVQWFNYLVSIKTLKKIAGKIENLKGMIFYNYQSVCQMRALAYCRRNKLWSAADITEWYLASKKNPVFYAIKQADTSFRMRYLNKKADGIIAISKYLNDYYVNSGCKNVIQLPPLVDLSEDKWIREPIEERKKIKLVYAGSPGDIKDNCMIVIRAVKQFKDKFELNVLGIDTEWLIQNGAGDYLGDHIVVHGRVSHKECLKQIKESDFQIFIRPDNLVTRAGFPTKLGESFACGTPVITNLSSNIGDYLIEGKNSFVIAKVSPKALEELLYKILLLTKDEIIEMKKFCINYDAFDYRNHLKSVSSWELEMNNIYI